MKNQDKSKMTDYQKIIKLDAWKSIFDAISRLTSAEDDLFSDNVEAIQEIYDLCEKVMEKVLKDCDLDTMPNNVVFRKIPGMKFPTLKLE